MTQHWAGQSRRLAGTLVKRLRGMGRSGGPEASREGAARLSVHDSWSLDVFAHAKLHAFFALQQRIAFPEVAEPRVSVVIPVWNQAQYTYMTLESLRANDAGVRFEVILVDNGSTDETTDLLQRTDGVQIHVNQSNLGFARACNQGARMARGDYVCFLNNDTVLTPGWLGALVRAVESNPACGAAGARLVLPDMRLQEAGGTIWEDGSCVGRGRGDDPFALEYSSVREVDYCSAACLLVRLDIFEAVGGFDERYSPAYYEDLDLCLAIAQAGQKVFYVPEATIFHLEHGSTDRTRAVALQLRNREIFRKKWGYILSGRGLPTPGSNAIR